MIVIVSVSRAGGTLCEGGENNDARPRCAVLSDSLLCVCYDVLFRRAGSCVSFVMLSVFFYLTLL